MRDARQFGVDLMIHRIATSEQYRASPTAVRCAWAFGDFLSAHVMLDVIDEERARKEAERG